MPQKRTLNTVIPQNALNNNGAKFTITIRRNDIDKINHLRVKMTIQTSGSPNVYNPTPYWFSRIDCRTSGDNQLICSTFDDTLLTNILNKTTKGRQRAVFRDINMDISDAGYLGLAAPTPVGTSISYLPLYFSGFFESLDLYLADSKADLNFDFYPAQAGIIASGSGTVQLTNMQFIIDSEQVSARDAEYYKTLYSQVSRETFFLDPVITSDSNRSLVPGTVNFIDLSNLNGLCSHHVIMVRQAGVSSVGGGRMRYINLGDNEGASLDLVDPSQQSVYGAGSAVNLKYIRNHLSIDSLDSDWLAHAPVYHLSYSDNFSASLSGIINGAQWFDGSKQQLALTLPAAPVQEVQSILPSAAVTSGSYRFLYKSQLSAELAYNATPSQMAAAFAAMKPAAARFATCVFSQALSAGGAVTCTFTHPQTSGLEGDLLQIVGNGTPSCATTVTTAGTAGVAAGTYDLVVYSYMFRRGSYLGGIVRSDQSQLMPSN